MNTGVDEFVTRYIAAQGGSPMTVDRLVTEPSGLDLAGMTAALSDPRLGRLGIQLIADFMAPEGSLYFDAIFGGYRGQQDIRNWLVPAMAEIEFIDFVPTMPGELFDDGEGGTSLDEWRMVANMNGERIPLSNGVSVRRYRNGWLDWACDVYDTGPFRTPPPPESGVEAAPLPPPPPLDWEQVDLGDAHPLSPQAEQWLAKRPAGRYGDAPLSGLSHADLNDLIHHPTTGWDWDVVGDLFHPTESIYLDPIFGDFRGQAEIKSWLVDVMTKVGNIAFRPLGPVLFNGAASVQEWVQVALLPDGTEVPMTRGTSVRRYADGWVMYAADYIDTAPLLAPEVQAASAACGSTITVDDIMKYRMRQR